MDDRTLALRGPVRRPEYDIDTVIDELTSYDDPNGWLVDEVCDYLFSDLPDDEMTERIARFDDVMHDERERVMHNVPGTDDVVMCTIEIEGCDVLTTYECPSAALLLELCAANAELEDRVTVTIVYGDSSRTVSRLTWPFPMQAAVEATTALRRDDIETDEQTEGGGKGRRRNITIVVDRSLLVSVGRLLGAVAAGALGGALTRRRR